jgi:hypothetical protein
MARRVGALWILAAAMVASCAQGSSIVGLGSGAASSTTGTGLGGAGVSSSTGSGGEATTSSTTSSSAGSGGSLTTAGSGGSLTTAGSGGAAGAGGVGGAGGSVTTPDAGSTGFGPCVTQMEIDDQGDTSVIGFCNNLFAGFACAFSCPDDAVNPGDLVCDPNCTCALLPPLCVSVSDAGSDAAPDMDAGSDAAPVTDASFDGPSVADAAVAVDAGP